MTDREANALADLRDEAKAAAKLLKRYHPKAAERLTAAVKEMEAATKEADGE